MTSEFFFHRTIVLAKTGRGNVSPNPEVGCVVVKDGKIIGEGFHQKYGEAHAEVNAILDAEISGYDVAGAEIYVSLEPCFHSSKVKKTPPCVDLLIQKKISKVFILHQDPNPEVSGRGAEKLQNAGIKVLWAEEKFPTIFETYKNFYQKFSYWIQKKSPYITLKLAQSADGFLGKKGERTEISGRECRVFTLEERDAHQAILVGANTVLIDNPTLAGKHTEPLRIILDAHHIFGSPAIRKKYTVFRDENFLLISAYTEIFELLVFLAEKNIASVFVEGGGNVAKKFLEAGTVNRYIQYTALTKISEEESSRNIDTYVRGIEISEYRNQYSEISEYWLGQDRVQILSGLISSKSSSTILS